MIDYYLRNKDKAEFDQLMLECGLCVTAEDGDFIPSTYNVLIDRIGTIYSQTGVDNEGNPVFSPIEGYHVNLRLIDDPTPEQISALELYNITPSTPYRMWA